MTSALAPHLIQLPGESWALWRCIGLRGAGFPAADVLQLAASPTVLAAANHFIELQAEAQRWYDLALQAVNEALDTLRRDGEWDNTAKRLPLVQLLQTLKKGKRPAPVDSGPLAITLNAWQEATLHLAAARAQFEQIYADSTVHLSRSLQQLCQQERFREAVIWQNRHAYHRGIKPFLETPDPTRNRDSRQRQREEFAASYLQRYCAKNDTVGFFGPIGWGQWADSSDGITIRPGRQLIASGTVFFESWAIDQLTEVIGRNAALQPWWCPRRQPYIHLEQGQLYQPMMPPILLPEKFALVLEACTGERSAKQIAADLLQTRTTEFATEAEVYHILEQLRTRQVIAWALEVPTGLRPEQTLRQLLERIDDEPLRRTALAPLDELEQARCAIINASGSAERLNQTLADLETTFTRLTGVLPTRGHGKTYAGRTLTYLDCRRDLDFDLGRDVLQALGKPLSLILTSARWLTQALAEPAQKIAREVYAKMVKQTGSKVVDVINYGFQLQPRLLAPDVPLVSNLMEALHERWSQILPLPAGQVEQSCVTFESDALRPQVEDLFAAAEAGWPNARYHCPDVMIAAESAEAIQRGDYLLVLGEIHLALHTLNQAFWLAQHPAPQDMLTAVDVDIPEPQLYYALPRYWPFMTSRSWRASPSSKDWFLEFGRDYSGLPSSQTVSIGELVMEEINGEVTLRTRDGRLQFNLLQFLSYMLSFMIISETVQFSVREGERHTPRLMIDRLVISRETWRFPASELEFAYLADGAERFLAVRRWAQAYHLPRFLFVRIPTTLEQKPFYLDLDSPIYVDLFAKLIRRAAEATQGTAEIKVAEMLPRLDQLWLPDAAGQRYTCELRLVAVDLARKQSPAPVT